MTQTADIVTQRLRIVPFGEHHLHERYVGWLKDPEVVRYSEQRYSTHTLESCRAYWSSFAGSPHFFWAIELLGEAGESSHVGNINAYLDPRHGLADVGILIGERRVWGKGVGLEAWTAVCHWLFESAGVRKITAGTLACNLGMLAIMDRSGMVDDGRHYRHYLFEGEEVDVVYRALFTQNHQGGK